MTQGMIALGISFFLGFFIYPFYISYLQKSTAEQKVSEYALEEFKEKQNTVTFGGLVFVVSLCLLFVRIALLSMLFPPLLVVYILILSYKSIRFIFEYNKKPHFCGFLLIYYNFLPLL